MKNGKYCNGKKSLNMKPLAVLLALTLLAGCAVGGTLAWLISTDDAVVNTFTPSTINIELTETKGGTNREFKMVPGSEIEKDPTVTVKADSEACWLFVKVKKSANLDNFIDYDMASGWTEYTAANVTGATYYYRTVAASDADQPFDVIGYTDDNGTAEKTDDVFTADKVLVKTTVDKDMMDNLNKSGATQPTLTFEAAAVQSENLTEIADAWAALPAAFKTA